MSQRLFIRAAQKIYKAIPFLAVRKLLFRTFALLMRRRRSVVVTVDGITYDLDLGELCDLCIYLQYYEPEVVAAMNRYTRPGMTIIDVGANIGAHALRFAKLTGPAGRVVAFEPTDFAFAKLARNLSLNAMPHVTAVKAALSDKVLPAQEINFRSSWRTNNSRKDWTSTVPFERLDAWLERNGLDRVDIMKVDIDGNEYPFIVGARETIARNRPLMFMEVVGPHLDDDARNPFLVLEGLGYRFRDSVTGAPQTIDDLRRRTPRNDVKISTSFNIIALPPALQEPE